MNREDRAKALATEQGKDWGELRPTERDVFRKQAQEEACADPSTWQRTTYTLTISQNEGCEPLDQVTIRDVINAAPETVPGFQSFHVEQGETIMQPTPEQEAMRRRVYAAVNDAQVNAAGPLLFDFTEGVLMEVDDLDADELDDEDRTHEIADSAVPVYTTERIALFTEDASLACWEPEIPAEPGTDVVTIAGLVLYDLAKSIADAAIEERRKQVESERETREERAEELREAGWEIAGDEYEAGDLTLEHLAKSVVFDDAETLAKVKGWIAEDN